MTIKIPSEFHITLDENQLAVVAAGLQELPAKHANPVLRHINEQIQKQITELETAAAKELAAQQQHDLSPSSQSQSPPSSSE
jgi:hypothetical protein